ncbi:hypothetical protein cce_3648 [Crocosphaera subtropica ATCC 51142]|uniref:Prepilin-type N-terminal cleavage/methylation domain-containing protein n=1 Tax=Crocosphaera subtropica (strain ATCC 51142 / BH68) TaxID=43989 RepID=B1X0V7_CROS5|nr:hypothetical protein [Crocosphaera subtropica]ACB52996.1 hypothetical protein cce_3648 [Crocosphaera subtropica ATCC 51142]
MNKPLLTLLLCPSKPNNDQGFSLFEVTIAILVSSAFLMGTLQAMTINAVMQIKSERQAKANFIIQQDIEKLQAAASSMDLDYIENNLNPDGKSKSQLCFRFKIPNMADVRFGADLVKELDDILTNDSEPSTKSDPAINTNTVFSSAQTFNQFKTDADGNVLYTNGQPVLNEQKDSVETSDSKKVVVQILMNDDILNKNYRLVRLMTVDSSTRYDVLQVYYRVGEPYDPNDPNQTDNDSDRLRDDQSGRKSIIAENYTEVIPAAVAECGF